MRHAYFVLAAWLLLMPGAGMAREIRFVSVDTLPWASVDARSGRAVGAFPDLLEELQRRTGHVMRTTLLPFARIEGELESGGQDCTIIVWNESRGRVVEKGETVHLHEMGVIASRAIALRSYEDLRGLSVSIIRGLSLNPRFDEDQAVRKEYDASYLIGARKVAHRRVDAVAGAIQTIRQVAGDGGLGDHLGEALVLGHMELALQCARQSPQLDLLPEMNKAIRDMRADGTLQRIFSKYRY